MDRSPLIESPRQKPAPVIPLSQESSFITWLESTGRLVARSGQATHYSKFNEDDPEISGLVDNEEIGDDFALGDDEELDLGED